MLGAARIVLVISATLALALPAGTSAAEDPANFRFEASVPAANVLGTPFVTLFLIDPFERAVPHVGRATVQIQFVTCSHTTACGPNGSAELSVRMTAPGGTLVLAGGSSSGRREENSGTWSVVEATGRFARLTGAGTYAWSWAATPLTFPGTVTLSLVGHLGKT